MTKRIKLENWTSCSGSRMFFTLLDDGYWVALEEHIAALSGAEVTGFVTDFLDQVWIDFTYRGHEFSVHCMWGDCSLSVRDPDCPEDILCDIATHGTTGGNPGQVQTKERLGK